MADSQNVSASGADIKPRVYRVRNLPAHLDRLSAVEFLCQCIKGLKAQDMRLYSLAYDVDVWSWLRTKTATITLHVRLAGFDSSLRGGECTIRMPGLAKPLIIDHHFQGVTPLNEVPEDEHKYDCVIISGLASHPFGSWQTHGHDKSFMWIRDDLPQRLPGVRFLAYGYDTTLVNSTSIQLIPDLAVSLVHTLKAIGWSAPSAKSVILLAHSLGGVVLKQALAILAGGEIRDRSVLMKMKGAIFFGVPSQGMSIPDIFKMLGDQPNVALVKDLSDQSRFLPKLDQQFGNFAYLQRLKFFWAFETKVTPSIEESSTGRFARTGPGTIMVSRESATRNLCHLQPSSTIQIDENHSDMVKFGIGQTYIAIIASKLENICAAPEQPISQLTPQSAQMLNLHGPVYLTSMARQPERFGKAPALGRPNIEHEWTMPGFWDIDEIISSLRAPERDRRLEQINQNLGDTFNWAYDDSSTGLNEWLRRGTGIFWIHGKPGSGKSTLMKYLYQDPRTGELLRAGGWQSRARLTTASFFFHHRGNHVQKSFEGLLGSLLSQILEREKSLVPLLYSVITKIYRTLVASAGLDNLERDIWAVLDSLHVPSSSKAAGMVEDIVSSQIEITRNRRLGMHLERMLIDLGVTINFRSEGPDQDRKVEFDDLEFYRTAKTDLPLEQNKAPSVLSGPRSRGEVLSRTVQRHYERLEKKPDIPWTRAGLEECLRKITEQCSFKLDLFLFLDALDEYDGRPEFIASFLQDLIRQPADAKGRSLTAVRILFSSRPWKALSDEFAAGPGFQIHDHTGNDIIEFCIASMPPANTSTGGYLAPCTTEIVRRARGVFLWVELVVRDLAKVVAGRSQVQDTQELEKDLRKTLDAIPDELDDYYQVILQRIPLGNRWESYVVLETLCRSEETLDTWASKRKLKNSDGPYMEWSERHIRAVTGGLVEIGWVSDKGEMVLQFMHQTVKQFVEGAWFRYQLLGGELGMFVTENGHSFIAKHLFVLSVLTDRFIRHARDAEATMGFSQYEFFSTAPPNYASPANRHHIGLPSTATMSVFAGLQLCIRDAWEADSSCIQKDSASIVSILRASTESEKDDIGDRMDRLINMTKLLVVKGLSIDVTDEDLLGIVKAVRSADSNWMSLFEDLAVLLLDSVKTTSTPTGESSYSNSTQFNTIGSAWAVNELFYQATPNLLRAMLARDFSPNTMDSAGNTSIDLILKQSPGTHMQGLQRKHNIVSQMVHKGGLLNQTRRSQWDKFENLCASSGLDTTIFRQADYPLWCSSGKPATKHRSLGVFVSQHIQP